MVRNHASRLATPHCYTKKKIKAPTYCPLNPYDLFVKAL